MTRHDRQSARHALIGTATRVAVAQGARTAGTAVVATLGWPLVASVLFVAAVSALILAAAAVMSISRMTADAATFVYQCQSRLGASVGSTASVQVITAVAAPETRGAAPTLSYELRYLQPETLPPAAATPTPSTAPAPTSAHDTAPQRNPYAALTVPPEADKRTAACAESVKTGEFVSPPIHTRGDESGRQVAELALRQAEPTATPARRTPTAPAATQSPADLVKSVYYQASRGKVLMPDTLAEQIGVGQRVDPTAISPGDLVFYRFTPESGPTAVMIAVNATHGIDPATATRPPVVSTLPAGNVIVKRPRMETR